MFHSPGESCEIGTSTKHARCQPFIQVIAFRSLFTISDEDRFSSKIVINCNRGRLVSYSGGRSGGWVLLIKQWLSIVLQCTPAVVQCFPVIGNKSFITFMAPHGMLVVSMHAHEQRSTNQCHKINKVTFESM